MLFFISDSVFQGNVNKCKRDMNYLSIWEEVSVIEEAVKEEKLQIRSITLVNID